MHAIILILCIVPLARGYDLAIGLNNYGIKIFDERRQASPAIWRQKENVTIEAAENEVITKVIIIDMRPEKDGDARIVDGGEGKKSVTIELQSPTVFRGYDFHLFVYSAPENLTNSDKSSSDPNSPTTSSDFMLHTNAVNTETPLVTTINPALKVSSENNRRVRTASEINSAGSMTSSQSDTFTNSPANSAYSSAVSNASTNSTELASGSAMSIASVTSTADSSSGSIVSDASTNSSATSNIGTDITNPLPASTEGTGLSNSDGTMAAQSVPGSIENDINAITATTPEEYTTSTTSIYATEATSVTTTLLPDMNMPNGNYFSDLNLMNNGGMRHVRTIEEENITTDGILIETTEMTTMTDILNENSTETISGSIDGLNNKDTRHSRGVTDTGTENYVSESTTEIIFPETTTDLPTTITEATENAGNTQVTTDSNIGNDVRLTRGTNIENSDNINETTTVLPEETTTDVSSGDGEDTSDIPVMNSEDETSSIIIPTENASLDLTPDVTIAETKESNLNPTGVDNNNEYSQMAQDSPSFIDQMLRNPRDAAKIGSSIFGDNSFNDPNVPNGSNSSIYPIFVDPSQVEAGETINSSEYVYVPVIALISKTSYPLFKEALQRLPGQTQVNSNMTT